VEFSAAIKAFSLGYLVSLIGLVISWSLWQLLRPRLSPRERADIGFAVLSGTFLTTFGLMTIVWLGVITGRIVMTTMRFMHLMSGPWGASLTIFGLVVFAASLILVLIAWYRGRVHLDSGGEVLEAHDGIDLLAVDGVSTIGLVGVLKPQIWVNPAYWATLSPAHKRLAVRHELFHLKRRDNIKKSALSVLAGLFAVLPFSTKIVRQFELDDELAIDDLCRRSFPGEDYPGLVAHAAGWVLREKLQPVLSCLSHSEMALRLEMLSRPPASQSSIMLALTGYALILVGASPTIVLLLWEDTRCMIACWLGY